VRQGIVAEAAGVSIPECLEAIDALRRASFVRTAGTSADDAVEPFHDRVREALAGALDAEAARRVHRELAAALEHGMREPRERAAEAAAAALAHALAFDQAAEM